MTSVIVVAPLDQTIEDTSCDVNGWPVFREKHDVDVINEKSLKHQTQSKSWDIKQKLLEQPAQGYHDKFELWPDGECKRAYSCKVVGSEVVASDNGTAMRRTTFMSSGVGSLSAAAAAAAAASKHLTGWAMRNTNNHNPHVLKKSCLGIIVCSLENRCPGMVRIRPAICDKARTKQIGKRCPIQGCDGTLKLQRCQGNRQFPVTHFWRKVKDTVFFQSRGTHDHPRPLMNNIENFLTAEVNEQLKKSRKRRAPNDEAIGDQEVPMKSIKTEAIWCESHTEAPPSVQLPHVIGFNFQTVDSLAPTGMGSVHDNVDEWTGHDEPERPSSFNASSDDSDWNRPTMAVDTPPSAFKFEPCLWSTDWTQYGGGYQQSSCAFSYNDLESVPWQPEQYSMATMSLASPTSSDATSSSYDSSYEADYHLMMTSYPSPPQQCMQGANYQYKATVQTPFKWHLSPTTAGYSVQAALSDCGSVDYLDTEDWSPICMYAGSSPKLSAPGSAVQASSNDFKWSFDECIIDGLAVLAKHAGVIFE